MSDNPEKAPAIQYAAALVEFLDRETGKTRIAMMYPISRVTLLPLNDPNRPQYAYAVNQRGEWFETDAIMPSRDTRTTLLTDLEQPDLFTDGAPRDKN